jgi:hypothetical protein
VAYRAALAWFLRKVWRLVHGRPVYKGNGGKPVCAQAGGAIVTWCASLYAERGAHPLGGLDFRKVYRRVGVVSAKGLVLAGPRPHHALEAWRSESSEPVRHMQAQGGAAV